MIFDFDKPGKVRGAQPHQQLVTGSIYGGVIFSFENGQATKIFLGAAAE